MTEEGLTPPTTLPEPVRRVIAPGVLAPGLAALLCVVVVVLTWRLFVTTRRGQMTEYAALEGSASPRESFGEISGQLLGTVSIPLLAVAVIGAFLIALLQRRVAVAIAAIAVLLMVNGTIQILQRTLERPDLAVAGASGNSFPSGHAGVASSVAVTALLIVPARWRALVALLGTLVSSAVGLATMVGTSNVAWHRASDVIASIVIAAAWYFVAESVLAAIAGRGNAPVSISATSVRAVLRFLGTLGVLTGALALGALLATALRVPVASELEEQIAFLGSALGVLAMVCLTQASLLRLRPRQRPDHGFPRAHEHPSA